MHKRSADCVDDSTQHDAHRQKRAKTGPDISGEAVQLPPKYIPEPSLDDFEPYRIDSYMMDVTDDVTEQTLLNLAHVSTRMRDYCQHAFRRRLSFVFKASERAVRGQGIEDKYLLSEEQENAVISIMKGKSIFLTGKAGTGKSVVITTAYAWLRKLKKAVGMTAMTGTAAVHVEGMTIHSYMGFGDSQRDFLGKIKRNDEAMARIQNTKIIFIDEISMGSAELIDELDAALRVIMKCKDKFFGGMQVVFCGDFLQLPPIIKILKGAKPKRTFAFESKKWRSLFIKGGAIVYYLTRVFRQLDPVYNSILNDMRVGRLSQRNWLRLQSAVNPALAEVAPDCAVRVFARNADKHYYNEKKMNSISGIAHQFVASDMTFITDENSEEHRSRLALLRNFPVPEVLWLKVGCRVMLKKNICIEMELSNGSCGVVVGFYGADGFPAEPTEDDMEYVKYMMKRQKRNNLESYWTDSTQQQQMMQAAQHTERIGCPVVKFDNGRTLTLTRQLWQIKRTVSCVNGDLRDETIASRVQIPLILAWAISVHGTQGLSFDKIVIDMNNFHTEGQAYVAFSRVRTFDGLILKNFIPQNVKANSAVVEYYTQFEK